MLKKSVKILTPCSRKCLNKVSEDQQIKMFNDYWNLNEYNMRRSYIAGLIDIVEPKVVTVNKSIKNPRNRLYSYRYL